MFKLCVGVSLQGHSGHLWAFSFRVVRATYGSLTKPAFIWPQVALTTLKLNAQKCACRDTSQQSLKACKYPPVVRTDQASWMRVETSSRNWNTSSCLRRGNLHQHCEKYISCLCGGVSLILGLWTSVDYVLYSVCVSGSFSIRPSASLSVSTCQSVCHIMTMMTLMISWHWCPASCITQLFLVC